MSRFDAVPAAVVHRAAMVARGPRACPHCECPTWTEPPVPWTGLRDYVTRCDWCERPVVVRIDRARIMRRRSAPATSQVPSDAVSELLDTPGARAFAHRALAGFGVLVLVGALLLRAGASPQLVSALLLVFVVPTALWAPSLMATCFSAFAARIRSARVRARRAARLRPAPREMVEVATGRWDQWLREERVRERDRMEHPDALLRELDRVLDDRELRTVRRLAEHGDVQSEQIDDLLRLRHGASLRPARSAERRAAG